MLLIYKQIVDNIDFFSIKIINLILIYVFIFKKNLVLGIYIWFNSFFSINIYSNLRFNHFKINHVNKYD